VERREGLGRDKDAWPELAASPVQVPRLKFGFLGGCASRALDCGAWMLYMGWSSAPEFEGYKNSSYFMTRLKELF